MARRRKSKYKKPVIFTSILVIAIFMATGYSLLSQTLKLEAEANLYASERYLWYQIINNHTSKNNGYFYENQFESGKYSYIGNNSNNYISLDGDLWRIMSVEKDHTIKVVKTNNTIVYAFDEVNNRTDSSTYCTQLENGCNSWASQISFTNSRINGTVENDSSLLGYLNTTFYNSLSQDLKDKIVQHVFNIGSVSTTSTFSEAIIEEQEYTWEGYIGLPTLTEMLYPNNNIDITIGQSYDNNYLLDSSSGNILWTITPVKNSSSLVWTVNYDKSQIGKIASLSTETKDNVTYNFIAMPTMYLKDTVKLVDGDGSMLNPFTIE